jgi:hypothetical protein
MPEESTTVNPETVQLSVDGVKRGDFDAAMVAYLQRARLTGSDRFVEARVALTSTWLDGLVERVTIDTDIDESRADAERLAEERG